jgi:hypothetical protein
MPPHPAERAGQADTTASLKENDAHE